VERSRLTRDDSHDSSEEYKQPVARLELRFCTPAARPSSSLLGSDSMAQSRPVRRSEGYLISSWRLCCYPTSCQILLLSGDLEHNGMITRGPSSCFMHT
jgi:hypothetical protein